MQIYIGNVDTGSGDITINADGSITDVGGADTNVDLTGATITLISAEEIGAAGDGAIDTNTSVGLIATVAGGFNIDILEVAAGGELPIELVTFSTGTINITAAGGGIVDSDNDLSVDITSDEAGTNVQCRARDNPPLQQGEGRRIQRLHRHRR